KAQVKIKFVGAVGSESYAEKLKKLAVRLGVVDRIEWCGFVSKEALVDLYANARAVVYAPQDEDYGYVALEGQIAGKPLITTDDSGGVLEFIDSNNGWVSEFDSAVFAEALDAAWSDSKRCEHLGLSGRDRYMSLNLSWSRVAEKLILK
ncbi:MAG: glycosyltransferase, partial [Verrucomicrobiota bacterium]